MTVHKLLRRLQEAEAAPIRLALSPSATQQELNRAHCPEYVKAFMNGTLTEAHQREIGFPWSPEFVERTLRITGGTLEAARLALQATAQDRNQAAVADDKHTGLGWGVEANQAGGTHHAFADRGEGFCIFNDAAVVARSALAGTLFSACGDGAPGVDASSREGEAEGFGSSSRSPGGGEDAGVPLQPPSDTTGCSGWQPDAPSDRSPRPPLPLRVRLVYIVDLDVHQGNGTAAILGSAADSRALTLSVHAERNYPWRTRSPSDIDIGLADDATEDEYLAAVREGLQALEKRGRLVLSTLADEQAVSASCCGDGTESPSAARGGHPAERSPVSPAYRSHEQPSERPAGGTPCNLLPGGCAVAPEGPVSAEGGSLAPPEVDLVLFQAGVDPLRSDRLGRLGLSRTALHERNALVFDWCFERGLPVVVMMGGGYSKPIEHSARAHADVFMQAGQLAKRRHAYGLGWSLLAPRPPP